MATSFRKSDLRQKATAERLGVSADRLRMELNRFRTMPAERIAALRKLVKQANRRKRAAVAKPAPEPPPKRPRGRPRKIL